MHIHVDPAPNAEPPFVLLSLNPFQEEAGSVHVVYGIGKIFSENKSVAAYFLKWKTVENLRN